MGEFKSFNIAAAVANSSRAGGAVGASNSADEWHDKFTQSCVA